MTSANIRLFTAPTDSSHSLEQQLQFALRALENAINHTDPNVIATAPSWLSAARAIATKLNISLPEYPIAQGIARL